MLSKAWRIVVVVGVAIAGFALLIAGAVMIVTPGPGWACIFLGLAVLASQFVWARRLLKRAKKTAIAARDKVLGRTSEDSDREQSVASRGCQPPVPPAPKTRG